MSIPSSTAQPSPPTAHADYSEYAEGLAAWRARNFAAAATAFARAAAHDPPSARFEQRARALAVNAPGADWVAVNTLDDK